jgi:hypothetical protein
MMGFASRLLVKTVAVFLGVAHSMKNPVKERTPLCTRSNKKAIGDDAIISGYLLYPFMIEINKNHISYQGCIDASCCESITK